MSRTSVSVAATALTMIGLEPISSFEDASTEADTARIIYEPIVAGLLTERYWHFAMTQRILNRQNASPIALFDSAYQMPKDPEPLRLQALFVQDRPITFDRYGDQLLCNAGVNETVVAKYVWRLPEADWPSFFESYVLEVLAARLAGAILRNADLMREHRELALRAQTNAFTADSQDRTPSQVRPTRILSRRR